MEKIVTSEDIFKIIEDKENTLYWKYYSLTNKVFKQRLEEDFLDHDLVENKNISFTEFRVIHELLKELKEMKG